MGIRDDASLAGFAAGDTSGAALELSGLRGRIAIDIVDGKHFYTFDYQLDDA
jgi:hypothetical protein